MLKKKNIKARETYAIVVDGETEVWYLQMLKRNERHLAINIEPKLPISKSLSDQYEMVETLSVDYSFFLLSNSRLSYTFPAIIGLSGGLIILPGSLL